ncbi:STAS domain-containing protein [Streptomyces somaliensis]|uniref:STAS domain-containing protein n=1 Tax=Streptomyces somaliensis TaxID=78355 RepID=UPI0020CE2187|nr:STAS domain-containing protein [Streptomyces somaliensis]MCP9944848.1 STAS domain-containing protein [Streptomyces somaliensis]MCP9961925.1 STAS domain-containing protein [Streptomyces somaliensis]MCP9974749.1 STAS domain-containing protein [Streptomyces somaliensis]MCQ0023997.1 STAS domain-containing protein [Streptomyces somaliensis DSM 40738]
MKDRDPVVLRLGGPIGPADATRLRDELAALLDGAAPGAAVVVDAAPLVRPDLAAVDALARLQLAARRRGHPLTVRNAGPGLRALLTLAGLADRLLRPPDDPGGRTAGTTGPRPGTT